MTTEHVRSGHRFSPRAEAVSAVAAVVVLYMILESLGITCPIKFVTGISCAGCGMSRAWLSLLRLDVRGAFFYHPLFFLPPLFVVVLLLKSKINIKIYKIFMFTMIMAFVIVYLYRMICGHDGVVVFQPRDGIILRMLQQIRE